MEYPNIEIERVRNTQIQKASKWDVTTRNENSREPKEEKREYNIPQGGRKTIKVRITYKNYQTSKEEEEKDEKCREEKHKESQEKRENVIEAETLLEISNDRNNSVKL